MKHEISEFTLSSLGFEGVTSGLDFGIKGFSSGGCNGGLGLILFFGGSSGGFGGERGFEMTLLTGAQVGHFGSLHFR